MYNLVETHGRASMLHGRAFMLRRVSMLHRASVLYRAFYVYQYKNIRLHIPQFHDSQKNS